VFPKAMKPILKQKSHPYEVYNESYKVIKSHIFRVRSWTHTLHIFNLIQ